MNSFDFFWQLVEKHGSVADCYKTECEEFWATFSEEEQRQIYRAIKQKFRSGGFVNFNPVLAIRDNVPKKPPRQVLTYNQYYARFHTTEEQGGWRMVKPENGNVYYEHG